MLMLPMWMSPKWISQTSWLASGSRRRVKDARIHADLSWSARINDAQQVRRQHDLLLCFARIGKGNRAMRGRIFVGANRPCEQVAECIPLSLGLALVRQWPVRLVECSPHERH